MGLLTIMSYILYKLLMNKEGLGEENRYRVKEASWNPDAVSSLEMDHYTCMGRFSGEALKFGVERNILQEDGNFRPVLRTLEEIAKDHSEDREVRILTRRWQGETLWKEIWLQFKPEDYPIE